MACPGLLFVSPALLEMDSKDKAAPQLPTSIAGDSISVGAAVKANPTIPGEVLYLKEMYPSEQKGYSVKGGGRRSLLPVNEREGILDRIDYRHPWDSSGHLTKKATGTPTGTHDANHVAVEAEEGAESARSIVSERDPQIRVGFASKFFGVQVNCS